MIFKNFLFQRIGNYCQYLPLRIEKLFYQYVPSNYSCIHIYLLCIKQCACFPLQTLHKGATDTEKEEFLKEALLMSNFKHSHILRLLGVCLDNDPQFIILELMEGGDLLSYLRSSRPTSVSIICRLTSIYRYRYKKHLNW